MSRLGQYGSAMTEIALEVVIGIVAVVPTVARWVYLKLWLPRWRKG